MATLIVRKLDEAVVAALKVRAAKHHCSMEEEHRKILMENLLQPPRKSFAEALAEIPNVGLDQDFVRPVDDDDIANVFD